MNHQAKHFDKSKLVFQPNCARVVGAETERRTEMTEKLRLQSTKRDPKTLRIN
jgi:hypothetical protein